MLKEGRYVFTYPSLFLNLCYRTYFFSWIICRFIRSPYLCNVFFIVLDLRLTKVGVQRYSFFYVRTLGSTGYKKRETRQKAKVSLEILKKLTINFFPNSLIHVPAS